VCIDGRTAKRGDPVKIKASGLTGKIQQIGRYGLVALIINDQPIMASRAYSPSELAIPGEEEGVADKYNIFEEVYKEVEIQLQNAR
jgi:hypothetical protein